jgi:GDP-L-fucose synthase
MNKNEKIFVAGAAGMVGSAIVRRLLSLGYTNLVGSYHARRPSPDLFTSNGHESDRVHSALKLVQADLMDQVEVNRLFETETPAFVFQAAARVGGIQANDIYPAQFIYDNLTIQGNVIHAAYKNAASRLLFMGSSCIYPKLAPQPIKEQHLLGGPLEATNAPYAIAKIAGLKMCESYNRQYGTQFVAVMPTNLYGQNDNFDLETSHVLPAMIRKFHDAKTNLKDAVEIWGTGNPRREFLHVNDVADACVFIMNLDDRRMAAHLLDYPKPCYVNIGSGVDHTIRELAEMVQEIVGFRGELVFDVSKPDGTPRKLLDVSRLRRLGWQSKIGLQEGIQMTYRWYQEQLASTH